MQESRNFDVFFGVFLVFGGEKKRRKRLGRREILEICLSSLSGVCLGLFIAAGAKIKAAAIVRSLAAFQWSPALILL